MAKLKQSSIFRENFYFIFVRFIFKENEINMCLVRFSTIEESFMAVAFLHRKCIEGRNMMISFTKSKI